MPLSHGKLDMSPDALAVADGYCPIHRGIHKFEIVRPRLGAQFDGTLLPDGQLPTHFLRSPFACAVQRPVDIHQIESTTAAERWQERLAVEEHLRDNPSHVAVGTRLALLSETLVAFDSALKIPVDKMNRAIATQSLYAVGAFAGFFAGLLITHFRVFTYASVLALAVAMLTPVVSKRVFSRRWSDSVMALVPAALEPLNVTTDQIRERVKSIDPALYRLRRRKTLRTFLDMTDAPQANHHPVGH